MSEQYEVAAWRHVRVAETLQGLGELDDSGYHSGVAGENALKALLQLSGMQQHWTALGIPPQHTPMRGHFPTLHGLVQQVQADIVAFATGRYGAAIVGFVASPTFAGRFQGWHINIRYADNVCTPISQASCDTWLNDARDFVLVTIL